MSERIELPERVVPAWPTIFSPWAEVVQTYRGAQPSATDEARLAWEVAWYVATNCALGGKLVRVEARSEVYNRIVVRLEFEAELDKEAGR